MKKQFLFLLIVVSVFLLSSCADVEQIKPCLIGHTYGFWGGLWHGWIAGISFIGSLFSDDISVYAINNSGGWYNFGFILGIGGFTSGSKKSL
jgi:hypothetical protein